MIERIRFKNFKALTNAEVKLGAFNLIVGPNGSGKSSLLQAFEALANPDQFIHRQWVTLGTTTKEFSIEVLWNAGRSSFWAGTLFKQEGLKPCIQHSSGDPLTQDTRGDFLTRVKSTRVYALESAKMAQAVDSRRVVELSRTGDNLAGALTYLRDQDEDAYDHLREELQRWLPEFDSIGFKNDQNGYRELSLRQVGSKQPVPASELSEGTLLALALLAIVYQPGAPTLIGLEEPDRGLHPRLLREVRDALYRLSFPSDFGLKRKPVQVVATTHSPLFLDLFKDHPEQIIIAEKNPNGTASFRSLADDPQLREMIGDAPLGEVWYSGVLGGVPTLK
jgi:predicted ATPase